MPAGSFLSFLFHAMAPQIGYGTGACIIMGRGWMDDHGRICRRMSQGLRGPVDRSDCRGKGAGWGHDWESWLYLDTNG